MRRFSASARRIPRRIFFARSRTTSVRAGDLPPSATRPGRRTWSVRWRQTVRKATNQGIALGIDLRLPTGDERNLLGTGAPGVSPFVAWSGNFGALSPHLNAGYQWNGDSILGGEP